MTDAPPGEPFPRCTAYAPEWVRSAASGGANPLWLTEWLSQAIDLAPGMRVLDLGCGRAASSVFLHREFGVQVWAADLWFSPTENLRRARDAGITDGVFPLRVNARSLPFADDFFDVIVSIDSFPYYGTDDLFVEEVARFLKPNGRLGIAGAGLVHELDGPPPEHLQAWWEPALWCLHSPQWWQRHWARTGIVADVTADLMPSGWQRWLAWQLEVAPNNAVEIAALEADQGGTLGYVRVTGRRAEGVTLSPPVTSIPTTYRPTPLLRGEA